MVKTIIEFINQHKWNLFFLLLVFLVTTLPWLTYIPVNWDAAQFVLGVEHFSVQMHQPHPPGYPLFIGLGKIFSLFSTAHTGLLIVQLLFSFVTVWLMYLLVYKLTQTNWIAIFLSVAWMFNPMFWFYREAALTYTIDACAGLTLAVLTFYVITTKQARFIYLSAGVLALFGGFRPSLVFLLFSLLILQWFFYGIKKWKTILISLGIVVVGCLAWYLPMIYISGGFHEYSTASTDLYSISAERTSFLYGAPVAITMAQIADVLAGITSGLNIILGLLIISFVILVNQLFHKRAVNWKYLITALVWVLPAFLLYCFVHFGQIGYSLIFLPLGYILSIPALLWLNQLNIKFWTWFKYIVFSLILLLHAGVFLFLSPSYSHPEFFPTTRLELYFQHTARYLPQLFKMNATKLQSDNKNNATRIDLIKTYKPEEVLIVTGRNFIYESSINGLKIRNDEVFRELGALLPDYLVLEVAPDRDYYMTTQNFETATIKDKQTITVPNSIHYVIFPFDQFPDNMSPSDDILYEKIENEGEPTYYLGIMTRPFKIIGYTIQREKDK